MKEDSYNFQSQNTKIGYSILDWMDPVIIIPLREERFFAK